MLDDNDTSVNITFSQKVKLTFIIFINSEGLDLSFNSIYMCFESQTLRLNPLYLS